MPRLRDASGLTLLEVVIAIAILSIALVGLATAFPISRLAVNEGIQYTQAANLAQDALERLKRVASLAPGIDGIPAGTIVDTPFLGYDRTVVVEDVEILGPIVTMKRVTATVTFNLQGQNVSATMVTLYTR